MARSLEAAVAAWLAALLLLVAGSAAEAQAPRSGGTLRAALRAEVSTFDPHKGASGTDHMYLYPVFDTLVRFDDKMNPRPGLAESWETPDPKTLVLKLRKDVKFHDGTPFNAEAVRFNLARAQDKADLVHGLRADQHRAGGGGGRVHRPAAPQGAGRLADPGLHGSRGHDGLARRGAEAGRPVRAHAGRRGRVPAWRAGSRAARCGSSASRTTTSRGAPISTRSCSGSSRTPTRASPRSGAARWTSSWRCPPRTSRRSRASATCAPSRGRRSPTGASSSTWPRPPLEKKAVREAMNLALDRPTLLRTIIFGLGEVVASPFPAGYWAPQPVAQAVAPRSGAREGQARRGRPAQRLHDGHGARAHARARAARGGHPGAVGRGRHQGGSQADGPGQGRAGLLPRQGADGGQLPLDGPARSRPERARHVPLHRLLQPGRPQGRAHRGADGPGQGDVSSQEDRRRIYQQIERGDPAGGDGHRHLRRVLARGDERGRCRATSRTSWASPCSAESGCRASKGGRDVGRFLRRRLLAVVPLLLLVTSMVFSLILLLPGDPAVALVGMEDASEEKLAAIRERLGPQPARSSCSTGAGSGGWRGATSACRSAPASR